MSKSLSALAIAAWMVLLFSGVVEYAQYSLLGGTLLSAGTVCGLLALVFIFASLTGIVVRGLLPISKRLRAVFAVTLAFPLTACAALYCGLLFEVFDGEAASTALRLGAAAVNALFCILCASEIQRNPHGFGVVWSRAIVVALTIYLPLGVLGIVQTVTNAAVIDANLVVFLDSSYSLDDVRKIQGYTVITGNFMGVGLRAFALYRSPLEFGYASLACLLIAVDKIFCDWTWSKRPVKFYWVLVAVVAFLGSICTLTRNIYVALFFALLFFLPLKLAAAVSNRTKRRGSTPLKLLYGYLATYPLSSVLLLTAVLLFSVFALLNLSAESQSLFLRFDTWGKAFYYLQELPILLFGTGKSQTNTNLLEALILDNSYIAIVFYSGILNLFAFVLLYALLHLRSIDVLLVEKRVNTAGWSALLSFFVCFPLLSVLNNLSAPYAWMLFCLPVYWLVGLTEFSRKGTHVTRNPNLC
jgi:hypothetical protein